MSPPYSAACTEYLAVPAPVASLATTPTLFTKFLVLIKLSPDVLPKANKAVPPDPYLAPAVWVLAVPTAETSEPITPLVLTKFDIAK